MTDAIASLTPLESLRYALDRGTLHAARQLLSALHPAEIAEFLTSLPLPERKLVWELVDTALDGEVLLHLNDDIRSGLIRDMAPDELQAAIAHLESDDRADFIQNLPEALSRQVLRSMDLQNRQRLETLLSYPEDSAGGLMNTDVVTIRQDVTLDVVLRYLRLRGELPKQTNILMVVDRQNRYVGIVRLRHLVTQHPDVTVADMMECDFAAIAVTLSACEVAKRFAQYDLISAPVIDEDGVLVGRITIDDVVDVIRNEAEHSILSMAGLAEEEDLFAPIMRSAKRRAVWLGINLLTAFVASGVIGLFEATLQQAVALAVLMPVVASMGGIAGTQTSTLMVRSLALGHVHPRTVPRLLLKELAVGFVNGLLWAIVVAAIALVWFGNVAISGIIAAAILINLLCAGLCGVVIPLALRALAIDPALASSVVLTTVTDVVGFFAFLGLATIWLL